MLPHARLLKLIVAVVVAAEILTLGSTAWSQNISPRGIGRRLRDDIPNTQAVKGKLVEAQRNGIIIENEGKQIPIGINNDTVVELGAKGPVEFLQIDSIVEITGE